jgi:hypothetical protein
MTRGRVRRLPTLLLLVAASAGANEFVVTNTDDSGAGSLRQAILDANALPDTDTIRFALPGSGPFTITVPNADLPAISAPVVIDGYTQAGAHPNTQAVGDDAVPLVVLTTPNSAFATVGLQVTGGGSTVRGLVVNGFSTAIQLSSAGGNTIAGNFFGTDPGGVVAVMSTAAHTGSGMLVDGSSDNVIGGNAPAARNLIVGPTLAIDGGATRNLVAGNLIGTDRGGAVALGDPIGSDTVSIGDTMPSPGNTVTGNVIAGSAAAAIRIKANDNVVQGNRIGTTAAGDAALGNAFDGIIVDQGAMGNTIGGTTAGAANVLSGNHGSGIIIAGASAGNTVQGNFIGTDATGTMPLGNDEDGVTIVGMATDNTIGGTAPGAGNVIAFNGGDGVHLADLGTVADAILGNAIHDNAGLGINLVPPLGGMGPPPNDLQPSPILTLAAGGCGTTAVEGTLDSAPGTYRLEFFASPACDPSGSGEGATFLGATSVNLAAGSAAFMAALPIAATPGDVLTATATSASMDTSGFSACLTVTIPACDPAGCSDGDPCTADGCGADGCCTHTPRTGFDSATCVYDEGGFHNAACAGVTIPRAVSKHLMRAQSLLATARNAPRKRAKRLVRLAAASLADALRAAKRGHRKLGACGDALVVFLTDARGRAQTLASSL